MSDDQGWILDLLRVMADDKHNDDCAIENLMWRLNQDGSLRVAVLCSDVFAWGTADAESIVADDIPEIARARDEVRAIVTTFPTPRPGTPLEPLGDGSADERWLDSLHWTDLWVARKRGMRPQGAYLNRSVKSPEVRQLFADAGPQRQGGVLGDPDHVELPRSTSCVVSAPEWERSMWAKVDPDAKRVHWFAARETKSACQQVSRALGSWRKPGKRCGNCVKAAQRAEAAS